MATTQATGRVFVCKLIEEYHNDPYCLELIQFFGWHPDTRFNALAILHALDVSGERRYIEKALSKLVDKGVIKTYYENDIALYCLTDNKALRRDVLEIAGIDWSQWQIMLRQSYINVFTYLTKQKRVSATNS